MLHFYVLGTGASKGGSGRRGAARRPGRPDPAAGGAASGPTRESPAVACARTCTPHSHSALVSSYTYPSRLVACARLSLAPTKLARGEAATRGFTACPLAMFLATLTLSDEQILKNASQGMLCRPAPLDPHLTASASAWHVQLGQLRFDRTLRCAWQVQREEIA